MGGNLEPQGTGGGAGEQVRATGCQMEATEREQVGAMGDKVGVSEDGTGWGAGAGSTVGVTHSYGSQVPRIC